MTTAPLRVAVVHHDFPALDTPGAVTSAPHRQQAALVSGLRARGHAVTRLGKPDHDRYLVTSGPTDIRTAPRTWTNASWFRLSKRAAWTVQRALGVPYLNIFSNVELADAARQCLPGHDLVHHFHGLYRSGVAHAARALGLPYVLFWDADELRELPAMGMAPSPLQRRVARRMAREALAVADRVVVVSSTSATWLADDWGVAPDRIAVLPNGVDVDRYAPTPEARQRVRNEEGWADAPIVIWVGAFQPWHDLDTLLSACAALVARHPDARLVLVGDGRGRPHAERQAHALRLTDRVTFMGAVPADRIPDLLAAADIAVVSQVEPFWGSPMKLYEYLAAGCTIVATSNGDVADVIDAGRNGELVQPGSSAALADVLTALIGDPSRRRRLAAQARHDALTRHRWSDRVRRLEAIYREVLEARAR